MTSWLGCVVCLWPLKIPSPSAVEKKNSVWISRRHAGTLFKDERHCLLSVYHTIVIIINRKGKDSKKIRTSICLDHGGDLVAWCLWWQGSYRCQMGGCGAERFLGNDVPIFVFGTLLIRFPECIGRYSHKSLGLGRLGVEFDSSALPSAMLLIFHPFESVELVAVVV